MIIELLTFSHSHTHSHTHTHTHSLSHLSLARPIFTWPPEGQQVAVGQNIRLRCKATGRPEPQIIWLHNGTEVSYK